MSSSITSEKDLIKVPKFNGSPDTYPRWQAMFMAVLDQKNLSELIDHVDHDTAVTPKDNDDCKDEAGIVNQERFKVKEQNKRAFSLLITSVSTDTDEGKLAFDTVKATKDKTLGYARGDFKKSWLDLQELMVPRNQATLLVSREENQNMKMKHNESPAVFMTKLKEVKSRMEDQGGRVIPEEEF